MRFQLIDRVLERDDEHVVAVKCVTAAEEYLADHFPGFAVLPGVMMLEALVQAGRLLVAGRGAATPFVLGEARNVRYGQMVRPGEQLTVNVRMRKEQPPDFELEGTGRVNEQVAVQARFTLTPIDHYRNGV